jgi:hypothetical protein
MGLTACVVGAGVVSVGRVDSAAQAAVGVGSIAGRVTADRGEPRGIRVKARDTVRRIAYTVYTRNGRYQIFNLPASRYEVQIVEEAYDTPLQTVEVTAGATKTVDLALKAKMRLHQGVPVWGASEGISTRDTPGDPNDRESLELVEFAALYPPNPAHLGEREGDDRSIPRHKLRSLV